LSGSAFASARACQWRIIQRKQGLRVPEVLATTGMHASGASKHKACHTVRPSSTNAKWGYIWGYLSGGPANKSKRIRDLAAEFDPMPHYRTEPEAWVAGETHTSTKRACLSLPASLASRYIAAKRVACVLVWCAQCACRARASPIMRAGDVRVTGERDPAGVCTRAAVRV